MEEIINYKLSVFLEQGIEKIEEYMGLMRYMKPIETKRQIFDLRLRDVQDVKDNLAEGTFKELIRCVEIAEDLDKEEVMKMKIVDFWGKVLSVKKQIEDINHMERVSLSTDRTNFHWEAVNGGDRLAKFGIYNTLDTLADGDILKYEAVLDLPYADVFTKMYMNRVKADIEAEMAQLKTRR